MRSDMFRSGGFFDRAGDWLGTALDKADSWADKNLEILGNLPDAVRAFSGQVRESVDDVRESYNDTLGQVGTTGQRSGVAHYVEQYKPLIVVGALFGAYLLISKK